MTQPPYDAPEPEQPAVTGWQDPSSAQQPSFDQAPPAYDGQPAYGQPAPGYPPAYGYVPAAPTDGMAITAMVLGIIGLVGMCGYGLGIFLSVPALILGRISMKKIDASGGMSGGRGFAQAGFIMGIIGTVLGVLWIVFWAFMITLAVTGNLE